MTVPRTTLAETGINQYALQYYYPVFEHFRADPTGVVTVEELAAAISNQQDEARREVAMRLHHATLPKRAEAGLIN
jgi:hypothetical protein